MKRVSTGIGMSIRRLIAIGVASAFALAAAQAASGQVDLVKSAIKKVSERAEKSEGRKPAGERETAAATGRSAVPGNVAGRVVFSKQPIDPENPANLTTNFSAGDHIYGALLLDGSLKDFVSDQYVRDPTKGFSVTRPGFEVDFMLDDSPLFDGTTKFVFSLDQKEGAMEAVPAENYLIFDIAPDPAQAKTYGYDKIFFPLLTAVGRPNNKAKAGAQYYSFHLSKLGAGSHTVKFAFIGNERLVGEFTIDGSDFAFYRNVSDGMDSVAGANATMPKSQWNDAGVTGSVARAYKKVGSESVLRTVLVSPNWFVQRNNIGLIIHRGLFAVIATKTAGGECYMQKEYFKQLYSGGRYGATMQDGRSETRQRIPCENVYK